MASIKNIQLLAERLKLSTLRAGGIDLSNEQQDHLEFLERILQQEVNARDAADYERRRIKSHIPIKKFLRELAKGSVGWQIDSLQQLQWIRDEQNVVIVGKCNTGKTSLAAYLGMLALDQEMCVIYCTAEEFLTMVKRKDTSDKYKRQFSYIGSCSLVIIDDLMYASMAMEDLRLLYHGLMFINEGRSIMLITNRELSTWLETTEDKHLMETMIDRITGNSQILRL